MLVSNRNILTDSSVLCNLFFHCFPFDFIADIRYTKKEICCWGQIMKMIRIISYLLVCILLFSCVQPAYALEAPSIQAAAIVLADMNSGNILYEKNMNVRRAPASLTKIMTGLLAVEAVERGEISLDDIVTAPADCWTGLDYDSSNAEISPGEKMTFGDYLYCALVKSANEACNVLAVAVSGNIQKFVNRMNARASELGATNTYFSDTNGLSSSNHYTTAHDLFLISREAMRHELFVTVVDTLAYTIPPTNTHAESRILKNSNALICQDGVYGDDYLYPGASGVKTGYTSAAGYCLVSTAEKNSIRLMAVLLGCDGFLNTGDETYGNFSGTISLYNWAFRNFSYRTVLGYGEAVKQFPVQYAKNNEPVTLRATEEVTLLIPKEMGEDEITYDVRVSYADLVAPIPAGTALGTVNVVIHGNTYASVPLATAAAVEMEKRDYLRAQLQEALSEPWIKTTAIAVFGGFLLALFLVLRFQAIKNRHLRERREAEIRRNREKDREENLARSKEAQEEMKQFRSSLPRGKKAAAPEDRYRITSVDPSRRELETGDISALFEKGETENPANEKE